LVDQEVALVEQVVRLLAGRLGGGYGAVQLRDLRADRVDLAHGQRLLLLRLRDDGLELRGERVEAVREAGRRLRERLAAREVLRRVRHVLPGGPVAREQRREPRVGRLVQRHLDLVEAVLLCLGVPLLHRLRAQLDVDEVVAHALVALHGDAGAEQAGRNDWLRRRRDEVRRLARVPRRVGVRDVVAGDVDLLLLREQAAQRRLETEEGRDPHQALASTVVVAWGVRRQPFGVYPASGAPESTRIRWSRKLSSCRIRTRFVVCTRCTSSSRPRSSAESRRAASASSGETIVAIESTVTSCAGMPSPAAAARSSSSRSRSSRSRVRSSCCTSASRASSVSTSCRLIASACASTIPSSLRADSTWRSRCATTPVIALRSSAGPAAGRVSRRGWTR